MSRIVTFAFFFATTLAATGAHAGAPLTRAITFQGELTQSGQPAQGAHDIEIALYNMPAGDTPIDVQAFDDVDVHDGLFTVTPDFTDAPFEDGYGYWLEVRVRAGDSTGAYTALAPRHTLTPVPYAVSALHVADDGFEADDIIEHAIGAREVDPAQIQTRVTGQCASAQMIQSINADGSVVCLGRGVTGIQVGLGIAGGGNVPVPTIAIDPTATQRRVSGVCQPGQYVRAIAEDGTVTCGDDSQTNIRAVEFVQTTCTLGPGPVGTNTCTSSALCPVGKRAIAGGFDVACAGVYVSRNGPTLTPNGTQWGWRTFIIRPSDVTCSPPNNIVTTFATCAAVD